MKFLITNIIVLLTLNTYSQHSNVSYSEKLLVMGTTFEVKAYASTYDSSFTAVKLAIAEAQRIDTLLSHYLPQSETSHINRMAGIRPVKVSSEVLQLIKRSKKISEVTNGCFDISFAAMSGIWRFNGTMKQLPSPDTIKKYRQLIDYRNIVVNDDSSTVFLPKRGMRISFGGIGQGFAATHCKALMIKYGIKCGFVNVSGDISFWGKQTDGSGWRVAIGSPNGPREAVAWMELTDMSVVTSGDYEQFVLIDGKRYTHIIDPRTGYPANDIRSVTIICPDTEVADGLSTGVFVLGEKAGLELVNKLKNIECVMITSDGRIVCSKNIKLNYTPLTESHFKIGKN